MRDTIPTPRTIAEQQRKERLPDRIPANFFGTLPDYFRIYFLNIFLTMITVGIYSAWAKVRNRRYFYGQTSFLRSTFDFDAQPKYILLSRLIVIAIVMIVFYVEVYFNLTIGEYGFGSLLFIFLLPILTVRGRSFNFRHTLWRGVRFHYAKKFLPSFAHLFLIFIPQIATFSLISFVAFHEANELPTVFTGKAWAQITFGLMAIYTLLLYPVGLWWRHRIIVNQLSLGKVEFVYAAPLRSYIKTYAIHLLILVAMWVFIGWQSLHLGETKETFYYYIGGFYLTIMLLLSMFAHMAYYFWNGVETADGSKLVATFSPLRYLLSIILVNFVLKVISLGMMVPRARVREWRYLANNIAFIPSDELRSFLAKTDDNIESALASEAIDLDGIDIDVGLI